MYKKKIVPGVVKTVLGALLMGISWLVASVLVPKIKKSILTPYQAGEDGFWIWAILTAIIVIGGIILLYMGIREMIRTAQYNKKVVQSGSYVKKVKEHNGLAVFFSKIGKAIAKFFVGIGKGIADLVKTFIHGDWKTKVSYFVMGFGNITRGQILRGLLSCFLRSSSSFTWSSRAAARTGCPCFPRSARLPRIRTAHITKCWISGLRRPAISRSASCCTAF